ncbi:MAG TPA: hypothetical protein VG710_15550 [Opitutus sp.]|nr:hypothetical protein [Opitutus sp.]
MNINDPTSGRVLRHGHGAGTISKADIERRARELAAIDGRSGAKITNDDLARARAELAGRNLPATTSEDVEGTVGISRDPSEPPSDSGHAEPQREGNDPEKSIERLALEGVEEAQHDQMLAARHLEHRQDEQEKKSR